MNLHESTTGVSEVAYLHSNLSLPHGLILFGGIAAHERYMQQTGADGLELTPTRVGRFMAGLLRRAEMVRTILSSNVPPEGREYFMLQHGYDLCKDWSEEDAAYKRLICSRHASFRKDTGDDGFIARRFPTMSEGFEDLRNVRCLVGDTPLVVYAGAPDNAAPDGLRKYSSHNAPSSRRTHQPNINNWNALGITERSPIDEIKTATGSVGVDYTTIDVFHMQQFDDPLGLTAKLARAGMVDAVHLAVNRTDYVPHGREDMKRATCFAERAFTRGESSAKRTIEGAMMEIVADEWAANPLYNGMATQIVLEEGPFGVHAAKSQAAMLETARTIIGHGRAQ